MNHNRNVEWYGILKIKKEGKRRGICMYMVVTAGLYDEQALEGPRGKIEGTILAPTLLNTTAIMSQNG